MIKSVTKIWSYNRETEQNDILGSYKMVLQDDTISFVPLDEANSDYQEIQKWVADGNTIAEGK
jgi:hypothetical protein